MAQTDGRQRTKSGHNDDIAEGAKTLIIIPPKDPTEIKPPIDLIPDEFPRERNGNVLVELVYGENDRNAKNLKECLTDLEYCVTETDKDRQKMHQHIDEKWVNGVFKKINENNYDGLIMIFAKVGYRNADITQLWSKFTSQTCPKLKNKPKIFIFQIVQRSAVDHTATSLNWPTGYETPAQADLLIIHDIYDPGRQDLLEQLDTSIEDHGSKEDLVTLAGLTYGYDYQPLIISTMTRKFYVKTHKHRGHHYDLHKKYQEIKQQIKQMKDKLSQTGKIIEEKPKKKELSFIVSLRKRFSFKKKNSNDKLEDSGGFSGAAAVADGKNVNKLVEQDETVQDPGSKEAAQKKSNGNKAKVVNNKVKKDEKKDQKKPSNLKLPATKSPGRKMSSPGSSLTNLEKINPRIRKVSTTSSDRRPSWKPI